MASMGNFYKDTAENELATTLAIAALRELGESQFMVSAALDVEKPETLRGFEIFKRALTIAYRRGVAGATADQCEHRWSYFGDQPNPRCDRCLKIGSPSDASLS